MEEFTYLLKHWALNTADIQDESNVFCSPDYCNSVSATGQPLGKELWEIMQRYKGPGDAGQTPATSLEEEHANTLL